MRTIVPDYLDVASTRARRIKASTSIRHWTGERLISLGSRRDSAKAGRVGTWLIAFGLFVINYRRADSQGVWYSGNPRKRNHGD